MNKATGCILFIGILIVGIALYGMNMVSAKPINTNTNVYRNADIMPARTAVTAAEQYNLNEQGDIKEQGDLKTNRGQETSNVNLNFPVPLYPSYTAGPGTTDGKPDNTGAGNPQQQPAVYNAPPPSLYGCWDRDGCW